MRDLLDEQLGLARAGAQLAVVGVLGTGGTGGPAERLAPEPRRLVEVSALAIDHERRELALVHVCLLAASSARARAGFESCTPRGSTFPRPGSRLPSRPPR